jgi:hypothetical protein
MQAVNNSYNRENLPEEKILKIKLLKIAAFKNLTNLQPHLDYNSLIA